MNPFVAVPASTIYAGPQPAIVKNDVLAFKKVTSTLEVLSLSTCPQVVKIYWLTPRFDTDVDPFNLFNNILAARSMGQVAASAAQTIATASVTAGAASADNIGQNPLAFKEFTNSWKVLKKIIVNVNPGDQINFKLDFIYNLVCTRTTFLETRQSKFLAGITVVPFVIVHGGLTGIATSTSDESSEVAYSTPHCGFMHNYTVVMGALGAGHQSTARVYKGAIEATTQFQRHVEDDDEVDTVKFA